MYLGEGTKPESSEFRFAALSYFTGSLLLAFASLLPVFLRLSHYLQVVALAAF